MKTFVGTAWSDYYKAGMSEAEALAFKAGFFAAIDAAQDHLVRRDCFTERTLRLLDEVASERG